MWQKEPFDYTAYTILEQKRNYLANSHWRVIVLVTLNYAKIKFEFNWSLFWYHWKNLPQMSSLWMIIMEITKIYKSVCKDKVIKNTPSVLNSSVIGVKFRWDSMKWKHQSPKLRFTHNRIKTYRQLESESNVLHKTSQGGILVYG